MTTGTVNGLPVTGKSWFDHEWASNQLGEDQVGWDWISLHLDDGSELMLFQLRKKDGSRDEHSSGTSIGADGSATPIGISDFTLDPVEFWTSSETGGKYPIAWRITIPGRQLELDLRAAMPDQELRLKPIVYWEGAVRVSGKSRGTPVTGKGYLEMTGYAGKIVGMQPGQ
jgi:predicted secreted hydrolase